MTARTIKAWYLVHKWTGLVSTLFLLMLCVTGLPLVFHEEIDGWLNPPAVLVPLPAGTPFRPLDTILAQATAAHPGEVPLYLSFDDERPMVYVTTALTPYADAGFHFQAYDRRTGAVVPTHEGGIMNLILRIHTDLLLGLPAELFLGFMGLLFAAAIVSGVVLYAPFMARLPFGTVRHDRSARVRTLDRHNLIGVVTLAWALVVGVTGTVNTLVLPLTAMWKADQLAAIAGPAGDAPALAGRSSVDAALAVALAAAPGMMPQFVAFPGVAYSSHRHYAVYLQGATPLTAKLLTPAMVDATSGRLSSIQPMPWYMQALLLAQPLHFGDYAGLPMKLLWALLDIATIVVLWTGLKLWLGRRAGTADVRVREVLAAGEGVA